MIDNSLTVCFAELSSSSEKKWGMILPLFQAIKARMHFPDASYHEGLRVSKIRMALDIM